MESDEGIGGRKFSLGRDGLGNVSLMQGSTVLATLTKEGEKVKHLLVTAPQLWDACNELLKLTGDDEVVQEIGAIEFITRMIPKIEEIGKLVAKSVNKDDWSKVLQS